MAFIALFTLVFQTPYNVMEAKTKDYNLQIHHFTSLYYITKDYMANL